MCNHYRADVWDCPALQHTATHCNTLQQTASTGSHSQKWPQHTATRCNTLQHTVSTSSHSQKKDCNTLQHTATHCNKLLPQVAILKRMYNLVWPDFWGCLPVLTEHAVHVASLLLRTCSITTDPTLRMSCTATHCNKLLPQVAIHQRMTATHYNTLQHTIPHCNTPQHTAKKCFHR